MLSPVVAGPCAQALQQRDKAVQTQPDYAGLIVSQNPQYLERCLVLENSRHSRVADVEPTDGQLARTQKRAYGKFRGNDAR